MNISSNYYTIQKCKQVLTQIINKQAKILISMGMPILVIVKTVYFNLKISINFKINKKKSLSKINLKVIIIISQTRKVARASRSLSKVKMVNLTIQMRTLIMIAILLKIIIVLNFIIIQILIVNKSKILPSKALTFQIRDIPRKLD